jgi:methylglutaconyl-CoA hydratase
MNNNNPVTLPPSYITKYNRFVDNILGRINKILRKNYDPVNVRLQTPTPTDNKKKGTTQKPKKKNKIESRER